MPEKLMSAFQRLYEGKVYRHRSSTHGDSVSAFLFEDLYDLAKNSGLAPKFVEHIESGSLVYNASNRVVNGIRVRRGDGLLGQAVPGEAVHRVSGYSVARAPVANIRIGIEMKIVSTAMMKQFDRVFCDIWKQHRIFELVTQNSIKVVIIAVNHSDEYRSYEGDKFYDSSPVREAQKTVIKFGQERQLYQIYDELLSLPFVVTNVEPYPFSWFERATTARLYNAALLRLANLYQQNF